VGLKRKNGEKREGKEKEKEGRKEGRKRDSQIHIPREKNANYKKNNFFIFLFNFFVFLKFFEMKLRLDLENPKTAIKKMGGGGR
jgi:hypothetical protein